MRDYQTLLLAFIALVILSLPACGRDLAQTPGEVSGVVDPFEPPEPPEDYAGRSNPLTNDPDTMAKGAALFAANCASCHGELGMGDGSVSASLDPRPPNLAANQKSLSDAYLFWRIAEGGALEPFRSQMPAWRSLLTDTHIWQIITYIRALEE